MTKPLTGPQAMALTVLRDLQDARRMTTPRAIAKVLWPDSPAWARRTRFHASAANNQGALGGTMPMNAAKILWRLHDLGLATVPHESTTWRITDKGRAHLAGESPP